MIKSISLTVLLLTLVGATVSRGQDQKIWIPSDISGYAGSTSDDGENVWFGRQVIPGGQSFLGIEGEEVDSETVRRLHLPEERGAVIRNVVPESGADAAGLRTDDVIIGLNDQSIESMAQLSRMIREIPVGRTIHLQVIRNGKPIELKATLGTRNVMLELENSRFNLDSIRSKFIHPDSSIMPFVVPAPYGTLVPHSLEQYRSRILEENGQSNLRGLPNGLQFQIDTFPNGYRLLLRNQPYLDTLQSQLELIEERLKEFDSQTLGARSVIVVPDCANVQFERFGEVTDVDTATVRYFTRIQLADNSNVGLKVQSVSPQLAEFFRLSSDEQGLLVSEVIEGKEAFVQGIRAGDVIVSVNGESISSPLQLYRRMSQEGPKRLVIVRNGVRMTFELAEEGGSRNVHPEADRPQSDIGLSARK